MEHKHKSGKKEEVIRVGEYGIFFKRPYQIMYMLNDFLIGIIFLIGSFFFLYESLKTAGCWLFAVGSLLLLIRPTIRLVHDIHYKRYSKNQ
ncbi:YrhK family protein [Terribacillus saccharophilus]|uniref:YrhK family protein n=1 Tax=Terribacillus saccharophilus TaxID=361277 RepID=UPI002989F5F8|nr:YrhK family protein [Terribacillus saccharophilus]MEC0284485.1 YrhK family protein [Terribacillus saccharophilus]MEC0290933.1 YrhK family protein [Terribacillus saccharophilus]